jgi:beta-lactamase regulating signal transducer with metallopeptidase domain
MQQDTFHKMIRYYFGGGLMFSYIAPFIQLDFRILPPTQFIPPAIIRNISDISEIYRHVEQQLPQTTVQWWQQYSFTNILTAIFVAGMVIMLIRFVIQYISLSYLNAYQQHRYKTYKILNIDGLIKPFSFGKRIYINPKLHTVKELDEIIRHELIHIRQYHSIDIIVSAINRCIFWWNPFVWILNEDIRNNLEYIVDNEMLRNGINRKHYQYHLLNINNFIYKNNMVNYFNFSNLKKRIKMMNKEKTQPVYMLKWLLLPLVATAMLLSFNITRANATNADFAVNSEITDPEQILEPENIIEGDTLVNKVPATTTSKLDGKTVCTKNTPIDTIPVKQKQISSDDEKFIIVNLLDSMGKQTQIIIAGKKKLDKDNLSKLNTKEIHSISVLKNGDASKAQILKDNDGIIVVATEDKENKDTLKSEISSSLPLIIIDGKESYAKELNISQDNINVLTILKNDAATDQYGEKGKNGVIIIKTKENAD